jgi:NAD(P)H-dependent FMN reductase
MICLISGSNRPNSNTLRVTKIYQKLYQALGVKTQLIDLTQLPSEIFLPTAYASKPTSFLPLVDSVLTSDGLHVFTPEYNGSFPGVLKLFIDHLKFPESFEKKPVAFTGLSAGMWGALRSVEQLEGIFKYRNAFLFNERVFLPKIDSQLNDKDDFTQEFTKQLVDSQVKNFVKFAQSLKRSL